MYHLKSGLARATAVASLVAALAIASPALAQRYAPTANPDRPRIVYADSLRSINDWCAVSHSKLNPRVRPVHVNAHPVGFC